MEQKSGNSDYYNCNGLSLRKPSHSYDNLIVLFEKIFSYFNYTIHPLAVITKHKIFPANYLIVCITSLAKYPFNVSINVFKAFV